MAKLSDKLTHLDYAILEILPMEGATFGNHTFAKQVASIVEELDDTDSPRIQGRLRSLKFHGCVVDVTVQPVGAGRGWQRTELGDHVLREVRGEEPSNVVPFRTANG